MQSFLSPRKRQAGPGLWQWTVDSRLHSCGCRLEAEKVFLGEPGTDGDLIWKREGRWLARTGVLKPDPSLLGRDPGPARRATAAESSQAKKRLSQGGVPGHNSINPPSDLKLKKPQTHLNLLFEREKGSGGRRG